MSGKAVPVRATPGPWRVGGRGGLAVEDAQGHTLASLGYGSRLRVSAAISNEENIANARLMAAAPEMLAALQGIIEAFGSINPYECAAAETAIGNAREVLRIAEGR